MDAQEVLIEERRRLVEREETFPPLLFLARRLLLRCARERHARPLREERQRILEVEIFDFHDEGEEIAALVAAEIAPRLRLRPDMERWRALGAEGRDARIGAPRLLRVGRTARSPRRDRGARGSDGWHLRSPCCSFGPMWKRDRDASHAPVYAMYVHCERGEPHPRPLSFAPGKGEGDSLGCPYKPSQNA